MMKLEDICTIQSGGTPSRSNSKYWKDGTIPWVKISDIDGKYLLRTEEKVTQEGIENSSAKLFKAGTILYSIFATLGEVCILKIDAATNQAIAGIQIKSDKVINEYLYYYLVSLKSSIQEKGRGVAQNNININILKNIGISLPPLSTQSEVIKILDKITELIELNKKQLQKLNMLVKSRFIEMFGNCVTNQKGWETRCLEKIAKVGSSKRVFVEDLRETGIPFYRGTEVGALSEGKKITPELFITEDHYAELCRATGTPKIGDLLMPSICPDGRIWLVNTNEPFYFKDGRVLWIHAIDSNYNPVFLLYTLKDRIMTDYSSIASGTTFAELKIFSLKKCRIFDAPIELQNKFAAFVAQTDKSKLAVQQSIEKLEILKKSLMQQYFGG